MAEKSVKQLLTIAALRAIGASEADAQKWLPHLVQTCEIYEISTPRRLAAFLAQLGHESGGLRHTVEIWGPTAAQRTYEGRKSLGNTQPGDGERFKGHGLIQVTGRYNHAAARDAMRERLLDPPDFELQPELLAEAPWAALTAGWYWHSRKLNDLADAGDFDGISDKINIGRKTEAEGDANGYRDRLARFVRVLDVVEATDVPAAAPTAAAPAPVQPHAPSPAPSRPIPAEESVMPLPVPLMIGLAGNLIDAFAPLVREKFTKELSRHTDNPEVAGQVAAGVIEAAQAFTKKSDPIDAVAAVKADPAVLEQVQASALEQLEKLAPMLEQLAQLEAKAWAAEEASRDAAAVRARSEEVDITRPLMRAALNYVWIVALIVAGLAGWQVYKSTTGEIKGEVLTMLSMIVAWVLAKAGSMFDYRFGTSRSSSAKDVLIDKLSTKR